MSRGISSFGALLKIGQGSPEAFTTIAGVLNFSDQRVRNVLKYLAHDSPGKAMEKVAGAKDRTLTLTINVLPDAHWDVGLEQVYEAGTLENWQLDVPDDAGTTVTYAFAAIVSNYQSAHPADGKLDGSVTLEISSTQTRTQA